MTPKTTERSGKSTPNPPEEPVPQTRARKNIGQIEATGLAEIQAALESSAYRGEKKARAKSSPKATVEPAVEAEKKEKTKKAVRTPRKTGKSSAVSETPRRRKTRVTTFPAYLRPPSNAKHHDLASFLAHAAHTKLNTSSNVYKGTHFEYTVASTLQSYNFALSRTGRSNDLGIDLVGHWKLPLHEPGDEGMPTLVQCKFAKPTPAMVRELEGAYVGAPAGWRGQGVLALLVSSQASTAGVRAAVQRSRWPLGVMQVTKEGELKQFLWNAAAAQAGLEGLNAAVRYDVGSETVPGGSTGEMATSMALSWLGKPWRPVAKRQQQNPLILDRALASGSTSAAVQAH